MGHGVASIGGCRAPAITDMFGGSAASQQKLHLPPRGGLAARRPSASRIRRWWVSTCRRIRSTNTSRAWRRCACRAGPSFQAAVKQRGDGRTARRHHDVQAGAQDPNRQQDGRREFLRHIRPVRGGAVFGRTGAISRRARARQIAWSSPSRPKTGRKASTCASRPRRPWRMRQARCRRRCASICATRARWVRWRTSSPRAARGRSASSSSRTRPQGEVEIELPDRYRISPQVAAAMRAVPGVVEVELV
jgi:hypothetical protein